MPKSQKTIVIKHIFDQLYDPATRTLIRSMVTATDLQDAKRYCNEFLGATIKLDSNPFNFMKDIVRGKAAAKIWPDRVRQLGFVGEQRTGGGQIFEFVPVVQGTSESFEIDFRPTDDTPSYQVQSLSLPLASKALGRTDESWLLQVAVNLRIIETHFAVGENRQIEALELNHLQMDIKLRKVQIDALYYVRHTPNLTAPSGAALITVEAKQGNQRILTEQIARQVKAAFESTSNDLIIPTAIAAIRGKGMYVVEFKAVHRSDIATFEAPVFHRDAMLVLRPAVQGI
ncbi:hypothetical protein [Duganella violaceipulchra]|uniref:Uncharacterized protein n=1 Tax=Duganella violaceipulchra TaxID=2849652 RepID=A0AA41HJF0_9BURK|nr:hypothetical protein [Duganella violaceicalia]MBV6325624.1 hypothetical protein [Duganella violaceicalia]MCP2012770.1 hypothetical protein [Duganella violaceicalia]